MMLWWSLRSSGSERIRRHGRYPRRYRLSVSLHLSRVVQAYPVDTCICRWFDIVFGFYYYCECRFFYLISWPSRWEYSRLISSSCPSREVNLIRKPLSIKLNSSIPGAPTRLSISSNSESMKRDLPSLPLSPFRYTQIPQIKDPSLQRQSTRILDDDGHPPSCTLLNFLTQ